MTCGANSLWAENSLYVVISETLGHRTTAIRISFVH
jgi:hypothetical protein